tara:strand:+ start:22453 stop:22854 length:402 start_codon:yes stop_codon:yes gene_type:complete
MIHAAAALVLLTLGVYFLMTILGIAANAKGELSKEYSLTKTGAPPPAWVGNAARNLINLCELPVLFYVFVAISYAADLPVTGLPLTLAWAFVASRVLHTLVHVTINNMGLRFLTHRIGAVILAVMWVQLLLAL